MWCGVEKWSLGVYLGLGSCVDTLGLVCSLGGMYQWLRIVKHRLGVPNSGLQCGGSCGVSGGHHKWEPMRDCNQYTSCRKCRVCGIGEVAEAISMGVNSEGFVLCKSSVE